jgi:hypothetical protein
MSKMDLYKCRCKECKLSDLCGLLVGQYCPWFNCEVPKWWEENE